MYKTAHAIWHWLVCCGTLLCLYGCRPDIEFGDSKLINRAQKPSWNELETKSRYFHRDTVFLEGQLHYQFEDVAVYEKGWFADTKIWIDFPDLDSISDATLQKTSGKNIRIVGIYNADDKGHLGQYNGTLGNVSYIWVD